MAGHRDMPETCLKEQEQSEIKNNIDISDEISCERGEERDIQNDSFCNNVKRYPRYDLLSLRNAQLSIHYPHCALRPELQALSIWTCRLRCELQYLGVWKIPNTGNSYGNCSCNGSCQSYTCDTQPYPSSNSQVNTVNSQMCYGNVQQSQQLSPLQTNSSPTLSSKKAARSRERFLNYQRCINTELIRVTSPSGGGGDGSMQYHLNHQVKPAFIDHRSISSSHLMPAFAKRRMSHANALHGQSDVGSNFNSNDGHNMEHLSNDNGSSESFETLVKPRKDSLKVANNQNDYHLYKVSANNRTDKGDQLADNQSGWINLVKKINSDLPPSINKLNNSGSGNKRLIYERRIGSGRLVPREVNWDMKSGTNKQIEKDNSNVVNNNGEKDISSGELDKQNIRNSSIVRYPDPRSQERRSFERRVSNSEDSNNGGSSNTNKRFTPTGIVEERTNFDSNYHQQTPHFTGQRSMSFRRREYVEQKDHHRDFRDFHESKDLREGRENREHRGDQHHRHNHHRDHKEEPEWFSEGPTSQHDTIELRGFEETDESQQQQEQNSSDQYSKIERNSSESSLLSHNRSSNVNLSTKDNFDISREVSNNSNNATNALDKGIDNGSRCNNANETMTANKESTDANESKTDVQQIGPTSEELENSDKRPSNVTELFFDNFLNIEALENTLIGNGNNQSGPASNDGGGSSRFSRWFFNNSNNNQNSNDEFSNNPPNKEDSKRLSKDLNESDLHSFMSFLKCNNFSTPELPKGLPSNVSALSVEELEARMRKMDTSEIEKNKGGAPNIHKNDSNQAKKSECENESHASPQPTEINTQDVEAFRKLLDQLGKPRVDISMNIALPNTPGQTSSLTTHAGSYSTDISPIPPPNSLRQSNIAKQEYMMKIMHQQQQILHHQQNAAKMGTPLLQHHHPHHRITQISPQQQTENMPLMSVPHHPHAHHMIMTHPQKRLDVQHLIQSVVREELSRSFLEKEIKNPNISPYTKEVISTVLKETSRYNPTLAGGQNVSDSIETASNSDISTTPNNLMQSLARGEVSLNLLEHELNKLYNVNIVKETPASGAFKERSRCGTPLASLNVVSTPTSSGVVIPLPPQVVPAQKQNLVLTSESVSSDQQQHQPVSSMLRSHHHEEFALHMPTQRELQMHTQAIMQNALFKKKLEIDHHEVLRRRQEIHKQQEHDSTTISQQHQQQSLNSNSTISQQGHQQPRHINSPTPLAFTPTSVLRKMTAEKDTITNSTQATTIASSSPQQIQPHLQQSHLKILTHSQIPYQHSNQPRMILGGGNFQYMHQQHHQVAPAANGSPQISPEQKPQLRNQPPGPLKWPLLHSSMEPNHSVLNMNTKPMGRPILKGPGPIQPLVAQNAHNPIGQNQSNVNQNSQSIQTACQMQKYPSIQQQPRQIIGQQFAAHLMQHQIPTSQQNNMQQQLFQQQQQQQQHQRSVVMHRQHIQQNDLGNHAPIPPSAHHPVCNDKNSVTNLNYQRDGGLSPTSNQLAQWFSPELLAQASAGKLPLLNINQALSLEEFERSIQHSSTAVNN